MGKGKGITAKNWRSNIRGEAALRRAMRQEVWKELKYLIQQSNGELRMPHKADVNLVVNLAAKFLRDYYVENEDAIIFGLGRIRREMLFRTKTVGFGEYTEEKDVHYISMRFKPRISFKRQEIEKFNSSIGIGEWVAKTKEP